MELRWGRETGTFERGIGPEEAELPGVLERLRTQPERRRVERPRPQLRGARLVRRPARALAPAVRPRPAVDPHERRPRRRSGRNAVARRRVPGRAGVACGRITRAGAYRSTRRWRRRRASVSRRRSRRTIAVSSSSSGASFPGATRDRRRLCPPSATRHEDLWPLIIAMVALPLRRAVPETVRCTSSSLWPSWARLP